MAFGKNPEHMAGVAPFGGSIHQRQRAATRRPKRGDGGGNIPYWADTFKPSDIVADTIRLIPGSYQVPRITDGNDPVLYVEDTPWWEYMEHYHGPPIKKGAICSSGPFRFFKEKREPCYGCDIFWVDYEERKRIAVEKEVKRVEHPKRISMREMFVYNVIDMGVFHKMPRTDVNGVMKMNPKTNQPYWDWTKCTQAGCPGCMQGVESKTGRIQPWPMGKNHFGALNGYADFISNSCTTCGGRDCVSWLMWQCGNPNCGHPIIRKNSTSYDMRQIQEITSAPFNCQQCGMTAYLLEMVECVNCSPKQMMPVRASVFDVDMQVKTQPSQDTNSTQLLVPAYSDPKPINPSYIELAKPIDLSARFHPDSLQKQAEIWRYTTPVAQQAASPQQYAQPYGQPPQQQYAQPQQPAEPQQQYAPPPQGFYNPQGGGQQQ